MLEKLRTKWGSTALMLALMFVSGAAMAEGGSVDTSAAVDALTDVQTAVAAIGVAMVGAAAAGIVYRWVTAFLVK